MPTSQLPTELWRHIFAFACTDGGQTGCALSLVSRYIHECSKPFKLRSVALHGVPQIYAFSALLSDVPASLNDVQHLFISDAKSDLQHCMFEITEELHTILSYTSATLCTLAIAIRHSCLSTLFVDVIDAPVALPALTELSLEYNSSQDYSPHEDSPLEILLDSLLVHPYPRLRYLDIAGVRPRRYDATRQICARLREIAPTLTHLRIPARMLKGVVRAMPPHDGVDNRVPQVQCLPSSIRRVLIPLSEEETEGCTNPFGTRVKIFVEVKAAADDCIVILEGQVVTRMQLEVAWLERVSGRAGRWDERGKMA